MQGLPRDACLGFSRPAPRVLAAAAAVVLVALISACLAGPADARTILAPKPGAVLDGPEKIVVKVGRGSVYARLNGERVDRRFLRISPRRRAVHVGSSQGLRPGRNLLRVRRETPSGATTRERVRFRVRSAGKIAGIAARGDHVAGSPLQLGARGEKGVAWCLTRAPAGSGRRSGGCESHRSTRESGFGDLAARRTTFTPDVPGVYRLKLTTGAGPTQSRDVLTVTAGQPTPIVALDVPTLGGANGAEQSPIVVGDESYFAAAGMGGGQELQVLVLDRRTLTPISNETYTCDGGSSCDAGVAAGVTADLQAIERAQGDEALVLVSTLQGIYPGADPTYTMGPETLGALRAIGFDPSVAFPSLGLGAENCVECHPIRPPAPDPAPSCSAACSTLAVVGIPGMNPGEAWALREDGPGSMSGALARDQYGNYRPVPTDHLPLTVRSDATATENTMQIGGAAQTDALPAGAAGGFQIVLVDGVSGDVLDHEVAVTNPASSSTVGEALGSLGTKLRNGDPGVVLVASLGSPVGDRTERPDDWNALAGFIEDHGGTRHAVLSMEEGETYAMAGRTRSGAAGGTEVGPAAISSQLGSSTPSPGSASLSGSLNRNDDDWRFSPSAGGELAAPSAEMAQTLYGPATPWPASDPGAMRCMSEALWPGLGITDARQAYWTQSSWDAARWNTFTGILNGLTFAAVKQLKDPTCSSPSFSQDVFTDLRSQLSGEFESVALVKDSIAAYQAPIEAVNTAQSDTPSIAQQVASAIQNGVQPPPSSPITLRQLTDALLTVAAVGFPEAAPEVEEFKTLGKAMGGLKSVVDFASDHAAAFQSGSPPEDSFQTTVARFGPDLNDRLETMSDGIGGLTPIILSDPKKLDAVATQFQPPDEGDTEAGLRLWIRQQAWEGMLPAKFPTGAVWAGLPVSESRDATGYECYTGTTWAESGAGIPVEQPGSWFEPFAKLPANGQARLLSGATAGGLQEDLWTFATWNRGNDVLQDPTLPSAAITNELFSPLDPDPISHTTDPGNFLTGGSYGMGFVPAHFFAEHYGAPYDVLAENPTSSDAWGYCRF